MAVVTVASMVQKRKKNTRKSACDCANLKKWSVLLNPSSSAGFTSDKQVSTLVMASFEREGLVSEKKTRRVIVRSTLHTVFALRTCIRGRGYTPAGR